MQNAENQKASENLELELTDVENRDLPAVVEAMAADSYCCCCCSCCC